MKKFAFVGVIVIGIFFTLPIIGNKVVESELNNQLELLASYGVKLEDFHSKKQFFHTKNHYRFIIQDSDKFMRYLSTLTNTQFDPSLKNTLEKASFGVDLVYSNFPLNDAVSSDIYLLNVSDFYMQKIKEHDRKFYAYFKKFLKKKGLLGHIEYNVLSNDFQGYVKDIDQTYTFDDNSTIIFRLKDSKYNGKGFVFSPEYFASKTKLLYLKINTQKEQLHFRADNYSSSTSFEDQNTYISSFNTDKISFTTKDLVDGNHFSFEIHALNLNLSSDMQDEKAQLYVKNGFDEMTLSEMDKRVKIVDFDYAVSIGGIDKSAYQKLQNILSKSDQPDEKPLDAKVMQSFIELLSKGIKLNVANFSVRDILQKSNDSLGGFQAKLQFGLKKDKEFAQKLYTQPQLLQKDASIDFDLRISRVLFDTLNKEFPVMTTSRSYFENEGEMMRLKLRANDAYVSVNGIRLK